MKNLQIVCCFCWCAYSQDLSLELAAWFLWQTMKENCGAHIAMASRFLLTALYRITVWFFLFLGLLKRAKFFLYTAKCATILDKVVSMSHNCRKFKRESLRNYSVKGAQIFSDNYCYCYARSQFSKIASENHKHITMRPKPKLITIHLTH